jgi:hypothetical protein
MSFFQCELKLRFFQLHVDRDCDFFNSMWVTTEIFLIARGSIFLVACGSELRIFQLHVGRNLYLFSCIRVVTQIFLLQRVNHFF